MEYSVGNRGDDANVHDIVYHIEVKRKYLYIFREDSRGLWQHIAKVPKSAVKNPEFINYREARGLYVDY